MSDELPQDLRTLDDFLWSGALGDDAMLLSELDGFLVGVIVCPDTIPPSEWLPVVWGEEDPAFESEDQARSILGLIMAHFNDTIGALDRGQYLPLYDHDTDDSVLWETWIEGFWRAVLLRPEAWLAHNDAGDEDLQRAVFSLSRLHALADTPATEPELVEIDGELEDLAPDLIPYAVEILHRTRGAKADPRAAAARSNRPKLGRNDPCPCGSGKKFKKCCLNS